MNMTFLDRIHWIAVVVAALAYFVLGALWYSKILFAPKWVAYTKVDMNDPNGKKGFGAIMFGSFIFMFITCIAIATLVAKFKMSGCWNGMKLGTLTGFCFGVSAISISYLYEKRPLGLHLINGGYTLIGNIIAAAIIAGWKF